MAETLELDRDRDGAGEPPALASFAPEGRGWIAVLPVVALGDDGRWLTGVPQTALEVHAGGLRPALWSGEVVLRDGRRLGVGPSGVLQVGVGPEGLRLRPLGRVARAIGPRMLEAARVELRLPGSDRTAPRGRPKSPF